MLITFTVVVDARDDYFKDVKEREIKRIMDCTIHEIKELLLTKSFAEGIQDSMVESDPSLPEPTDNKFEDVLNRKQFTTKFLFVPLTESEYDFMRSLSKHYCAEHGSDFMRWYDRLYDEAVCTKCNHVSRKISYDEYLKNFNAAKNKEQINILNTNGGNNAD